jgi:hypothetical protein
VSGYETGDAAGHGRAAEAGVALEHVPGDEHGSRREYRTVGRSLHRQRDVRDRRVVHHASPTPA